MHPQKRRGFWPSQAWKSFALLRLSSFSASVKTKQHSAPDYSTFSGKRSLWRVLSLKRILLCKTTVFCVISGHGAFIFQTLLFMLCNLWSRKKINGNWLFKKKCQLSCSFVFCWSLLLFNPDMVHKQCLKVWFLTSQMSVSSGRINFVHFQQFQIHVLKKFPWNTANKVKNLHRPKTLLFKTCRTPCKKPLFPTWSRSWYTFF